MFGANSFAEFAPNNLIVARSRAKCKWFHFVDFFRPRFYFAGLDPDASYTLTEVCRKDSPDHWEGSTFTGRFLMQQGIEIGFHGEYASKVIRLVRK